MNHYSHPVVGAVPGEQFGDLEVAVTEGGHGDGVCHTHEAPHYLGPGTALPLAHLVIIMMIMIVMMMMTHLLYQQHLREVRVVERLAGGLHPASAALLSVELKQKY